MADERKFLDFLFDLAQRPPHAAAFTRRRLMQAMGRTAMGAGAMAAMARQLGSVPAFAADAAALPEITQIPETLKGSGMVRVSSYGGAYQAAQHKAYFEPFERLSGIKVIESEGPDPVKVKAMVDTKNIEFDVGEFDRGQVINLAKKGDYWEEIDYSLIDTPNIDKVFMHKLAVDMMAYSQIYAYRTDVFKDAKPSGWADFWDTKKFPGARTMPAGAGGLEPDLEAASMAMGVPPEKLYPIDIDKAYDSLAKIKPAVVKWWTSGAVPAQMLTNKEVALAEAWHGRINTIQAAGVPVAIAWKQGTLRKDCWTVPKGSPNRANAMKFIAFTLLPISQARLSLLYPNGFVNNKAVEYIPPERLKVLPTAPDIKKELVVYSSEWWSENRDKIIDKWAAWVLQ